MVLKGKVFIYPGKRYLDEGWLYRHFCREGQERHLCLCQLVFILQLYEFVFGVAATFFLVAHAALAADIMVVIAHFYRGDAPHAVVYIHHYPTGNGDIQNG